VKVALVSPYDLGVPGGVQSHVEQLAAELTRLGDTVTVLGPGSPARHATPAPDRTDAHPTWLGLGRSHAIPFNGSLAPIALDPRVGRRVGRALRDIDPDVIHVHEPMVPAVGPAAVWSKAAPVVATFHAWSDRAGAYRLARPVARRLLTHVAVRIAVSDAAASYHAGALGVPAGSFRVVPNGVDAARFGDAAPLASVHEPTRPTLLFVGRLEHRKGLEQLVRAFTLLRAERSDLRLLVVGDGPERARCEQLLPARLRADVRFLGRVAQDELPGCYAAADVYVSPALGGESFGIVLLEAMAAGTPVVASDIPGYRTVVTDGVDGRLVAPGDPRALAVAIGALLDAPALGRALATEGRRRAARADWSVVAATLRSSYVDALRAT
jgi:phosphatidyl-myo-inositol alpha-mannosyltransferase